MMNRLKFLMACIGYGATLFGGGVVGVGIAVWLLPTVRLMHETHGAIGFLFGLIFVSAAFITNALAWIITGKSFVEKAFGL